MKKSIAKKLLFSKNTVASLNLNDLSKAKGGYISAEGTCITECATCTQDAFCTWGICEK